MSIVVGTLTIDLTANTASFSQSMDKMSQLSAKSASDIKRSLEKIALAGLAMATAVAGGVTAMIKGALDSADAMSKMAQSAGTTTETLSVLTYAAGLSNVSTEALAKGLEKLSVAAFKAQNGNVQLERIFARLGVGVTDANGKLKDSGQLMQELSVRFAKIGDSSGKTALAIALFGKAGAAMIPLLNQYGSEQEKVNEEAHSFGLILSTSTTEVAARAHDNLEKLGAVLKGIGFSILGATLPALDSLLERIVQIAKDANIPDLARAFGEKVTTAVTLLGKALDFAASHAHALKLALEALAAIQLAKIAIPIVGDLAAGGLANVSKGLDKATIGLLGLQRTLPVLAKFGTWVSETAQFIALLATEEGLASAATYVLGGAFVAVGGWVGIAVGAVVGLGVALYKFRDANFEIADSTYKLRDAWTAAGGAISKAFGWLATDVETHLANIRKIWTEFANWFSANPIVSELSKVASKLLSLEERFAEAQRKFAERLIPQGAIDALNQAKKQREDEDSIRPFLGLIKVPEKAAVKKPAPDTAGLGKPEKDPFGEEIRKLDEAIAAQKAYLGALDGTAEAIAKVTAEEKANAIILQIKNKMVSEGRLGANQSLPASQQAAIQQRVATEESLKSLVDYGREIVGQQHSAELSIKQTRAMAAANLEGDAAVRRAAVDNAILGLTFLRTGDAADKMSGEVAELRSLLNAKSSIEIVAGANKQIDGLRDELAQRQLVTAATLGSIDAQRQAALSSKLYTVNQQIADTTDEDAHQALIAKRDALIDVAKAEWAAADAQAALSLRSPIEQYQQQADALNHAVDALATLQGGITYGQSLQIAARQQEDFNRATDETISLLLNEGSAADGVTAFFLKMQEQGKSTATILYDAFSQAFDKISQGFTGVITAQNRWQRNQAWNQFGQLFDDVGKSLLNSTIKSGLQGGLGAVGKAFGIDLGAVGKKLDGSSAANALWVRMASSTGSAVSALGAGVGSSSTSSDSSGILGGVLSALGIKSKQGPLGGESLGLPTSIPQPSAPTNELDDLFGVIPGASQIALGGGGSTTLASGPSGIFSGILSKIFGSQRGGLGGESLGLPTSIPRPPTATNELDNLLGNQPQAPALEALAKQPLLHYRGFGEPPAGVPDVIDDTSIAPPSNGGNELTGLFGGQSDPASGILALAKKVLTPTLPTSPDGAPSGGANELEGLLGLTPSAATTTPGAPLSADQILIPENPIPNPPDVQAQTQTLITRPEPSMWQGLLGSVIGAGAKLLPLLGFAGGGKVSGPGTAMSDSIPARLSHGEFVVNAASTAKFLPMLQQINSGESPTRVVGRSSSKAASYGMPVRMAFGGRAVMPSLPSYSSAPAHKPFANTRGGGSSGIAFRRAFANGGFVSLSSMQFDDGGFVSPSSAYESDSGRDFMSAAAERIVSNSYSNQSQRAGDTHTHYIDARGSNDPAQTTAHLDRYMRANGPKLAAAALHALKDQQLRRAPSAR